MTESQRIENDILRLSVIIRDREQRKKGAGKPLMPWIKRFKEELAKAKAEHDEFQEILDMANQS